MHLKHLAAVSVAFACFGIAAPLSPAGVDAAHGLEFDRRIEQRNVMDGEVWIFKRIAHGNQYSAEDKRNAHGDQYSAEDKRNAHGDQYSAEDKRNAHGNQYSAEDKRNAHGDQYSAEDKRNAHGDQYSAED